MSWVDALADSQPIVRVYGDGIPSLVGISIHEVRFDRNASTIYLRFDLSSFPERPPVKWTAAGSNTVQLELRFSGVRSVKLEGWSSEMFADLRIERKGPSTVVAWVEPAPHMEIVAESVFVARIQAYIDSTRQRE
ncbi:hypothetical protein G4H71_20385 [Rhodococcus triatomae]|uniref:Immunity protein 50 n=1 Tax=Rhodococcus triatomae TaxID=300028 RepID=A0A1G8S5V6_9NOCA|nr:Imm50 family immunity protein [Rhodococcus triatomae]QNG19001.1 hypothetical protein G4H72_09995 [Rhodococcus triatomae]QNG25086.1 hypothetical protein G4H71_20385 [Rhodococcus triatomae]SDJ24563.1 Immunity protein 50 [Rhodococcus triatomae]